MLISRGLVALACALCLALPSCTAQRRAAVGGAVAGIGFAAMGAGFCIATAFPCDSDDDDPDPWAPTAGTAPTFADHGNAREAYPELGVTTLFVGLGLVVIGGVLYGTGATAAAGSSSPPKTAPAVPAGPSPAPTF